MPPPETTRRIASATALVALLFVATAALRGYVPGAVPPPREPPADDPLALVVVVVLLLGAVAVVAIAVIARLRNRVPTAPRVAGRPEWLRGDRSRPTWRAAVIAFGVILGWLLLSVLLGNVGNRDDVNADGSDAGSPPGSTPTATSATPDPGRAAPRPDSDVGSELLDYFYGATVVFLFVLVGGSLVARRKGRHTTSLAPLDDPLDDSLDDEAQRLDSRSETLARAAEVGLAAVEDLSREPRTAIIACYAAMERQLSLLPDAAPREFDTASEVLARAVEHGALAPDSATQLVDLFEEARFSPHVMDEGHRDAAVAVLTQVLDQLRSHA